MWLAMAMIVIALLLLVAKVGLPQTLPLLGNLHQLGMKTPHRNLSRLAATSRTRLEPLLLRLGTNAHALVLSDVTSAKRFLLHTPHDRLFAGRPPFQFVTHLLYGPSAGLAFCSDAHTWHIMRRACQLHLFSPKHLRTSFQPLLRDETLALLLRLHSQLQGGQVDVDVDVASVSRDFVSGVMSRMVLSHPGHSDLMNIFQQTTEAIVPLVGDFIPCFSWLLDWRSKRAMALAHARLDAFWDGIIHERQQERFLHQADDSSRNDFLDTLLSEPEVRDLGPDNLKATLMDILGAGTETTAITIEWAMAELLRNPHAMAKLHAELSQVCNSKRPQDKSTEPCMALATEDDICHLRYLRAVVKETLRLHPPVPLLIPRALHDPGQDPDVQNDVYTNSFPRNTWLLLNAWTMGRDPDVWASADAFWPDRFLQMSREEQESVMELLRGEEEWKRKVVAFGYGRRACPGMGLGLSMIETALANLLLNFRWQLPCGMRPCDLNMDEKNSSSATHKETALIAKISRSTVPHS